MGRFRDTGNDEGTTDGIDISPLIDCVFILLIFFIVATTFVEETGVTVDKPEAAAAERLEKNSILIALTDGGEVVYGGRPIGVQGVQPLVKRLLQAERGDPLPVIIQADKVATSELLVRVVGEAKLGGADKISIATAPSRS